MPRISVLIPTFNRAHFLGECLDSLLEQSVPATQVLVVNDGSEDGTSEVLARFAGRVETLDTAQVGKAAAINAGMARVSGDYLWIFDDDDVALPDALERFVAPLEADPGAGYSFSPFFYTGTAEDGRIGRVQSALELPDLDALGPLVPLLEDNYLGGAALFARVSCYREVGPFDPALVRSQDYEMALRLVRRTRGVRAAGGPTFHYRQHDEERGSSQDRFAADQRMRKWLEYDRAIFVKLYRELPLEAYLPPGVPLAGRRRQALLERMTVMAGKLAMEEAAADLRALADEADAGPVGADEARILRLFTRFWYNRVAFLPERRSFPRALRTLASRSANAARVRAELARLFRTHAWRARSRRVWRETFARLADLYL